MQIPAVTINFIYLDVWLIIVVLLIFVYRSGDLSRESVERGLFPDRQHRPSLSW